MEEFFTKEGMDTSCLYSSPEVKQYLGLEGEYTKAAREQLEKLPREVSLRVTKYMEDRAALLPREYGKAMTGDYAEFWRYRVGAYRMICSLHDDVLMIEFIRVGHRSDVYKR